MAKMSSITAKHLSISLALVLALPLGLSGCQKEPTAQEIASRTVAAYSAVKTYAASENVTATTEVVGGDRPGKTTRSQDSARLTDIADKRMKIATNQHGWPGPGMQTSIDTYILSDWWYGKFDVLEVVDKDHEIWVKMELEERYWADQDRLAQQIKLLRTATEVTLVGSESVNGIDSYVLEIKPDWQVLTEWLSLQPPWRGPDHLDLRNLSRSLSIRQWIAKDTHLLLRAEIEAVYGMVPFDFSRSTVELKGQVNFYDYNKPVKIELPEDAVKAVHGPIS